MSLTKNIKGSQVKDLITKYFYRNNQLCFQILLHLEGNETIMYKEYNDHAEYKKAFNELQKIRTKDSILSVPNKNLNFDSKGVKVA